MLNGSWMAFALIALLTVAAHWHIATERRYAACPACQCAAAGGVTQPPPPPSMTAAGAEPPSPTATPVPARAPLASEPVTAPPLDATPPTLTTYPPDSCFQPARQLHPPLNVSRPGPEVMAQVLPDHMVRRLQGSRDLLATLQRQVEQATFPSVVRMSPGTEEQLARCGRKFAVFTMAGGYPWRTVAPCFKSFQDSRDACTFMHGLVEPSLSPMAHRKGPGIVLEDVHAYSELARRLLSESLSHMHRKEVLRVGILMLFASKYRDTYSGIIAADSRDMLYMNDPFTRLQAKYPFASDGEDYTFLVVEDAGFAPLANVDDIPSRINNMWVRKLAGNRACEIIINETKVSGFAKPPILNSGLIGGTPRAISHLVGLQASVLKGSPDVGGLDQGAMNLLVYMGLELAAFPYRLMLLDNGSGPYRHHYEYKRETRDANEMHLNCLGEIYSMVHQYDRYPEYGRFIQRYLRP